MVVGQPLFNENKMNGYMIRLINIVLFSFVFSIHLEANIPQKLNIIFIGNSITEATYLKCGPTCFTVEYLQMLDYKVKFANCGVSGSTTVDFLPGLGRCYSKVVAAADTLYETGCQLIFSIMLGTNDSAMRGPIGAPVAPSDYKRNLQTIIDDLKAKYPLSKIILNRPVWYSPNTHNSAPYLQEGFDRLRLYTPQLQALVKENSGYVYRGDWDGYDFFKKNHLDYHNPQHGNSGIFYLHPNAEGAKKLGEFWAKQIDRNVRKWSKNKR